MEIKEQSGLRAVLQDVEIPQVYVVRQHFERDGIPDIPAYLHEKLNRGDLKSRIDSRNSGLQRVGLYSAGQPLCSVDVGRSTALPGCVADRPRLFKHKRFKSGLHLLWGSSEIQLEPIGFVIMTIIYTFAQILILTPGKNGEELCAGCRCGADCWNLAVLHLQNSAECPASFRHSEHIWTVREGKL